MTDLGFIFSPAFFLLMAAAYVYIAVCLSIIARKTGTPDGWMAWVPLLNIFLMCRIARKPAWMILLLLIPLINLVVFVILWMAIARARLKPAALGILIVIPVVNLLLPLILASGPASGAIPGATPASTIPPKLTVCPACGSPECIEEDFCAYTGQRIKPVSAPGAPAAPPSIQPGSQVQPGLLAKVILGVIIAIAAVYFGFGLFSSVGSLFSGGKTAPADKGQPPSDQVAASKGQPAAQHEETEREFPKRMAGTLTEFPVDTAAVPARPKSVVVRNPFNSPSKLPPKSLPPGFPEAALNRTAAMTSASYQVLPTDPPVNVHVVDSVIPQSAEIAQAVAARSASAEMSGVKVVSPTGAEFAGYRVRTPESVFYAFDKLGSDILVMIYAPDASVKAVADRLAANIGNGNGLNDDPEVGASLAGLPTEVPGELELTEATAFYGDSLQGSMEQFRTALDRAFGSEASAMIDKLKRLIPPHVILAKYNDKEFDDVDMVLGSFGGETSAWLAWQTLRLTAGLGETKSVPFNGGTALSSVDASGPEYLLFRRGSSIGLISNATGNRGVPLHLAEAIH